MMSLPHKTPIVPVALANNREIKGVGNGLGSFEVLVFCSITRVRPLPLAAQEVLIFPVSGAILELQFVAW